MERKLLLSTLLALYVSLAIGCKQAESGPITLRESLNTNAVAFAKTPQKSDEPVVTTERAAIGEVWVCKSAAAKRYHPSRNCQGLKKCEHTIEKTTVKAAEASGLTLCKFED